MPAQDWTKIVNEESQGLVEISYRSGFEPGRPPDVRAIQRQMAIVAWQPGPNRILHVPSEVRGAAARARWRAAGARARPPSSRAARSRSRKRAPTWPTPLPPPAACAPARSHASNATPALALQDELQQLQVGEAIERIPPLPSQRIPYTNTIKRVPVQKTEPFEGTWEVLTTGPDSRPFLDR